MIPATPPATRINPSGQSDPVWYAAATLPSFPPLSQNARADVCVVGAGIAGLTTAYLLAKAGRSVILLDEKPIAGGESGRTSAHLSCVIDDRFEHIAKLHGQEGARIQYESHAAAIDTIERISREEGIDCDFKRIDGYLFLGPGYKEEFLDRELAAAQRAGFTGAQRLSCPPSHNSIGPSIHFPRQARFHPLKYLSGLAVACQRLGVRIHCGTRVMDMTGGAGQVEVKTASAYSVIASAGVAATNVPSPINNWAGVYTKQAPYRTYIVGLRLPKDSITDALYWDTLDPYHYVRIEPAADHDVLITGGEDHKTGQHAGASDQLQRFSNLEQWTRQHFSAAGDLLFRWSGQVNEPEDGVAFIGRVPTSNHENCYVITGDSGMGLTHGTLGAVLVSDLILNRPNPWAKLYDPARKPLKLSAVKEFLKENVNAAKEMARDYLSPGEVRTAEEVAPGHGALLRQGLTKLAVYKDSSGTLHKCSAVCTHLQCVVHWNDVEQSWDCPCHGSRFDPYGKVLTGPAVDDLPPA